MKRRAVVITLVIVVLVIAAIVIAGVVIFHEKNNKSLVPVGSNTVAAEPGSVAWEATCIYTNDLSVAEKDPLNVCSLNLFDQKLTAIPASVFTMKNLEYLNLADNQITEVPSDIGSLTRLKWLYLNQNPIVSLPDSIGTLADLQLLTISYDKISSLPSNLSGLKSIQAILVQGNPLPPPEVSRIKSIFAQAKVVY